jgi:hypothetical protein
MGEAGAESESYLRDLIGGGYDINPDLSGNLKFDRFDEMMLTSPAVKSLLMFSGLPIRQARWGADPGAEDPLGRVICDATAWQFGLNGEMGQLDMSWDELNQQGLKALGYGPCIEEIVWGSDVVEWKDADGNSHLLRPIDRVAPRWPKTITKARFDRGQLVEVRQSLSGTSPIIHSEERPKLSYFVFERDPNGWGGIPMIRPAYGPWKIQKHLLIAAGIGWDRFASGLPVVWHPNTEDGERRAKAIGRSIRQHERAYAHMPGPKGGEWDIEILNAAATLADPVPLLQFCSEQIAEVGMQTFKMLGSSSSGNRALGDVLVDPFFLSVMAYAQHLQRERLRQLIKPFVRINFGVEAAETHLPKLTVSRIQSRSLQTIAQAISLFADAGLTFTDRDTVDDIRDLLGLSELPDELGDSGITKEALTGVLQSIGLDSATFAKIIEALPPEIGVARNKAPEGSPIPVAA